VTAGSNQPLVSIVVPVLNEQENIESLYRTVNEVMSGIPDYDYEFVFTDNRSTDRSFQILATLAKNDRRVRAIRFSKNFGYQRSIWTAYSRARGDVAIQLDCDLQDPPALIPEFLRLWKQGYKVVYGVRKSRASEAFWMQWARKLFYRVIDYLSEDRLPHDAGDFRLVDRCILNELKKLDDPRPYLRGAIARMGFDQIGVPYDRKDREKGSSKFKFKQLFGLAADGILNHSIIPLRLASYTGIVVALITLAGMAIVVTGKWILHKDWPAGFATTTILILIGISLNALFLGIIGEYLGRIYQQVKKHPVTIETIVPDENDPR
jgi:glycosyltransferase involved in cell wall biosynthesis